MGYDVGFIKDQYGCNSNKCECAHFDETIIGKLDCIYRYIIAQTVIQATLLYLEKQFTS